MGHLLMTSRKQEPHLNLKMNILLSCKQSTGFVVICEMFPRLRDFIYECSEIVPISGKEQGHSVRWTSWNFKVEPKFVRQIVVFGRAER